MIFCITYKKLNIKSFFSKNSYYDAILGGNIMAKERFRNIRNACTSAVTPSLKSKIDTSLGRRILLIANERVGMTGACGFRKSNSTPGNRLDYVDYNRHSKF